MVQPPCLAPQIKRVPYGQTSRGRGNLQGGDKYFGAFIYEVFPSSLCSLFHPSQCGGSGLSAYCPWARLPRGQDFLEETECLGVSEGSRASPPLRCWAREEREFMGPRSSTVVAWLPDTPQKLHTQAQERTGEWV